MSKQKDTCKKCNKFKEIHTKDGWCNVCYKKLRWIRKKGICKRCERLIPMHAKGLCAGCYNSVFHIDKVKEHNARRYHNIEPELYKEVTKNCKICSFDKIVEMHHLDHNKNNNSNDNLVGLCPNHHKMLHSKNYQKEIFDILKDKGFTVPEGNKMDGFFKK